MRCHFATGIKTVVVESTGIYWVAAFEVLESRGLEVVLANAREVRAVPGWKSDVNDGWWLQSLHACGLLRASFRPGRDIAEPRAYLAPTRPIQAWATVITYVMTDEGWL